MTIGVRIGLISEGEAELGTSVPFLYDPKQGGTPIDHSQEGALHTLIRRELTAVGFPNCVFIHRHPTPRDNLMRYRMGYSVIEKRYLQQTIIAWKPQEIDIIVVVVDEDSDVATRTRQLEVAKTIVEANHLDEQGNTIENGHVIAVAIKTFDTWLISDIQAVEQLLQISLPADLPDDFEELSSDTKSPTHAKNIFDNAVDNSDYVPLEPRVKNRNLEARWAVAQMVDLDIIKKRCKRGYLVFTNLLLNVVSAFFSDKG